MRKQQSTTLAGQSSLLKLWNAKDGVSSSNLQASGSRGSDSLSSKKLYQVGGGSSSTDERKEDSYVSNVPNQKALQRDSRPSATPFNTEPKKPKGKRKPEEANPRGDSQKKLPAIFYSKSAAQGPPSRLNQEADSVIDIEVTSGILEGSSSSGLKRTHSAPLHSLPQAPCMKPNQPMPSSQPLESQIKLIDLSKEPNDSIEPIVGGSRDAPITLDASPSRGRPGPTRAPQETGASSFFAPRRKAGSNRLKLRAVGEGNHAPYTTSEKILHVRGPQSTFEAPALTFSRSNHGVLTAVASISPQMGPPNLRNPNRVDSPEIGTFLMLPLGLMEDGHAQAESVLQSHLSKSAFAKFLCPDHDISGSTLNERWRPRCAAEVLGNAEQAIFLRDWLLALQIQEKTNVEPPQGSIGAPKQARRVVKRPAIIRSVNRSRKRRRIDSDEESLDDWIASDNDEDDQVGISEDEEDFHGRLRSQTPIADREAAEDEENESGSPWKPKHTRANWRRPPDSARSESPIKEEMPFRLPVHAFLDRLSNCILLAGPSGVGKTAAVYACAEELGWEVFEVYPGIGKRNGASLMSLVGDVTKNHIVKRGIDSASRDPSAQATRRANFFQPRSKTDKDGKDYVNENTIFSPFEAKPQTYAAQQSIILLEEADILFAEDSGFWQTVVTLIKDSRRPVVMTCNDINLVPSAMLPLQETLHFKPAPVEDASDYLHCIAIAEGCMSSIDHMRSLYKSRLKPEPLDVTDDLLRSRMNTEEQPPDLRQAINNLQFLCQAVPGFDEPIPAPRHPDASEEELLAGTLSLEDALDDLGCRLSSDAPSLGTLSLHKLWRISDSLSAVESQLARSPGSTLKVHCLGNEVGNEDEMLGYNLLEPEIDDAHLQDGIAFFNADDSFTVEASESAKRLIGAISTSASSESETTLPERTQTRPAPKRKDFLRNRMALLERKMNILGKVVPNASRQDMNALISDYEPWVRAIDRSDSEQEKIAVEVAQTRAANANVAGRLTRNSNRAAFEYGRYFDLEDEERRAWHERGLQGQCFQGQLSQW